MGVCTECERETRSEWKFCVYCGTRIVPLSLPVPAAAGAAASSPASAAVTGDATATPARPIDPLAVISLVLGVLFSPFAAVFGHVALARLRRSYHRGRLAAIIGTVLGYGWTVLAIAIVAQWAAARG